MADAHAARTCRLCSGTRIQHAFSVGVGNVLMILRVIFVMIGQSINGSQPWTRSCIPHPPSLGPRLQSLTTARGNLPVVRTRSTTVRSGAPWSVLTATARTKLNDRECLLQRRSAANPANTRRGTITAGVPLRPREAEARQLALSLTRTSRIRRPARAGPTCRHARHPAGTMTPSWMTR